MTLMRGVLRGRFVQGVRVLPGVEEAVVSHIMKVTIKVTMRVTMRVTIRATIKVTMRATIRATIRILIVNRVQLERAVLAKTINYAAVAARVKSVTAHRDVGKTTHVVPDRRVRDRGSAPPAAAGVEGTVVEMLPFAHQEQSATALPAAPEAPAFPAAAVEATASLPTALFMDNHLTAGAVEIAQPFRLAAMCAAIRGKPPSV